MVNRRGSLALTALLAIGVAGCAQDDADEPDATQRAGATEAPTPTRTATPSPSPEAEIPEGWAMHEVGEFSIAVPEE